MNAGSRSVLIVEPSPVGHHLYYVRLLVEHAARAGLHPIVATSEEVRRSSDYAVHLEPAEHAFELVMSPHEPLSADDIEALAVAVGPTSVVVPDGDALCRELARRGRWGGPPLSLLIMREFGQEGRVPVAVKTIAKRLVRRRAGAIPGVRVVVLKPPSWAFRGSERIAVDPITLRDTDDSRSRVRDALDRVGRPVLWLGVLGSIDGRKSLPEILTALIDADRPDLGIAIAGKGEQATLDRIAPLLEELRRRGHPVVLVDRKLEEADFDAFVRELDVLVIAYRNDGPSGLFGKCLAAGTRVLASGSPTLRREASRFPDHAVWVPLRTATLAAAMRRTASRKPPELDLTNTDLFSGALLAEATR